MMPAVVLLVSFVVTQQSSPWQRIWLILLLLTGLLYAGNEFYFDYQSLDVFYQQKQLVLDTVNELAQGQSYQLYVYEPDIYDFAWQYVIIHNAYTGRLAAPLFFSYQAGDQSYLPFKGELLNKIPRQTGTAQQIFYLLDRPDNCNEYFQTWQRSVPNFSQADYIMTLGQNMEIWQFAR